MTHKITSVFAADNSPQNTNPESPQLTILS